MKKMLITFSFLSVFGIGLVALLNLSPKDAIADEVVVYQSRTCGCCQKWVSHLKNNGFKVKSEFLDDVTVAKNRLGVPMRMASCHTAVVNGYIVEGHVPASAIKELLAKKPAVKGIAVPGMPMGSPGMEGSHKEQFDVISFGDNGTQKFMSFN